MEKPATLIRAEKNSRDTSAVAPEKSAESNKQKGMSCCGPNE